MREATNRILVGLLLALLALWAASILAGALKHTVGEVGRLQPCLGCGSGAWGNK